MDGDQGYRYIVAAALAVNVLAIAGPALAVKLPTSASVRSRARSRWRHIASSELTRGSPTGIIPAMRLARTAFLATAILTGLAIPAGGAPQTGCLQGRTVLRTDEMRVFHSARRGDRRFYTCIHDRPPIRSMIWMRRHVQAIAAAGHFFAYAWGYSQQYPAAVVVRNARFNRLVFLRYYGVGSDDKNYPSDPSERSLGAEALLVTQRGRVAWIEGARLPDGRVRHNVYTTGLSSHIRWDRAFDPITDPPDIVDWGTHIDPDSLRLVGTRVTWRKGRRNKSASLR